MNKNSQANHDLSRRRFIQKSSLAVAGATAALNVPMVHATDRGKRTTIKVGLIGCGGRGTGAVLDAIGAATKSVYPAQGYHTEDVAEGAKVEKTDIEVLALADLFEDRLERCRANLAKLDMNIPAEQSFLGFDAYRKLLAHPDINYVILATPPHFRPEQLMAAVEAGKNVFLEKPAAVDVPGVKRVMAAGQLARQKGLGIAAGTQRRHLPSYRETIRQVREGAIGEIVYAKCYWNGGEIWVVNRKPGWTDLEWQLRNWNYFTWLSGDHIVEQHVHNLDVMNWVLGTHPLKAVSGLGGRQARTGKKHGHVFDHFAVEYEYPNGVTMFSQCRQINRCKSMVGEEIIGSLGTSNCKDRWKLKNGEAWQYREKQPSGYKLEHEHLIASIRAGKPINEAEAIAESTMTAIIGREAAYSGQEIVWDEAMKSDVHLGPGRYDVDPYPIPPVAIPGKYRFA